MKKRRKKARKKSTTRRRKASPRRRAKRTARRKSSRRKRRRKNPGGMPVVLVNPSGGKMARRRRRRRSTTKRRRRNPTRALYRRRNPTVKFKDAAVGTALGALGGAIAYGINWGVSYIPVESGMAKTAIFAGAGAATAIGLSTLADSRVGCGVAGAVGYQLTHMVALEVQTRQASDAGAVYRRKEGGAVYTMPRGRVREGGAVYRREAGALVGGARTMRTPGLGGPNFKEAGASKYVPGPVRWYGPQSWAYKYGDSGRAGVRYVSAHNA